MDSENEDNPTESIEEDSEQPIDVIEESPINEEQIFDNPVVQNCAKDPKFRSTKLPLARVRHIMKMDPECQIISQDAVLAVTKATELFLRNLTTQMVKYTLQNKRKTVLKRDFDATVESNPNLCFLDGTID